MLITCRCNTCSSSAGSKRIFLLHMFKEPMLDRKMHKEVSFHYGRKYFNFLQQKSMFMCNSFRGRGRLAPPPPPLVGKATIHINNVYVQVSPVLMVQLSNLDILLILIVPGFMLWRGITIFLSLLILTHYRYLRPKLKYYPLAFQRCMYM